MQFRWRSHLKNSCFGFHQGFQTPRNNESTRPAALCFLLFLGCLELLMKPSHSFLINYVNSIKTLDLMYCSVENCMPISFPANVSQNIKWTSNWISKELNTSDEPKRLLSAKCILAQLKAWLPHYARLFGWLLTCYLSS